MKYLLDSNAFIQAKNSYYGMAICPGFWDWILHANNNQEICSIKFVQKELEKGDDELALWAKNNSHIFIPVDDEPTQNSLSEVAGHVASLPNLIDGAASDFLRGADPWLIAKAKVNQAIVVTQETLDLKNRKKIKIPNICQHFGIKYLNTFELLHKLNVQFVMLKSRSINEGN